jgi:hypothetical protein
VLAIAEHGRARVRLVIDDETEVSPCAFRLGLVSILRERDAQCLTSELRALGIGHVSDVSLRGAHRHGGRDARHPPAGAVPQVTFEPLQMQPMQSQDGLPWHSVGTAAQPTEIKASAIEA